MTGTVTVTPRPTDPTSRPGDRDSHSKPDLPCGPQYGRGPRRRRRSADGQDALHASLPVAGNRAEERVRAGLELECEGGRAALADDLAVLVDAPSSAMPWSSGAGLFMVMVTVPALALSVLVLNFSAPLGSAESLTA
jgi:hypothetical protein